MNTLKDRRTIERVGRGIKREEMICPIGWINPQCQMCCFVKQGLCDYPYCGKKDLAELKKFYLKTGADNVAGGYVKNARI